MKRFRVVEHSMLPTLTPGSEFVASSSIHPDPGAVVAFPHPRDDDFWLVKRVVPRPGLDPGQIWVESDNDDVDSVDSRVLGPIDGSTALTRVDRLDPTTFAEAVGLLQVEDADIARLVSRFGVPDFWRRPEGFATLVLLILEQQVSLESGAAMYARLVDAYGAVTVERMNLLHEDQLRDIGVTRQKSTYLLGLASAIASGQLDLEGLANMGPDDAIQRLETIRGVGQWTAGAYVLAAIGAPDVFPIGDRALQVGARDLLGMTSTPNPEELELIAETWRPIRAVAARLIWHGYLTERGRSEPEVDGLGR